MSKAGARVKKLNDYVDDSSALSSSTDAASQSLAISGRWGHAEFINGHYDLLDDVVCGKPSYQSTHAIPDGYGEASGHSVFLYYHADNDAWVLSHQLSSLDVVAYAPSHIKNIWHVNNGKGPFVPDPSVKISSAANGQVITQLGAWTAEIEGEVALKIEKDGPGSERAITVTELFEQTAQRFPDCNAYYSTNPSGEFVARTYRQYYQDSQTVARAFVSLGLNLGGVVGIFGVSAPEWLLSSNAAIMAGGVVCALPLGATDETLVYMLESTGVNVLVLDDNTALQKVLKMRARLPALHAIIMYRNAPQFDNDMVHSWPEIMAKGRDVPVDSSLGQEAERRVETLRANRACIIAWTDGVAAAPKACLISHDNITWTVRALAAAMGVSSAQEKLVAYLPLHQIFAQLFEVYLPMATANPVYFAKPDAMRGSVVDTLCLVQPTLFLADPLIWTRLKARVERDFSAKDAAVARRGQKSSIRQHLGQQSSSFKFKMADRSVFSKVKKALGLDSARVLLTAFGPPLAETMEYFFSVSMPIYDVYGLVESTGIHTISLPGMARPQSTGKVLAGTQIRLVQGTHEVLAFGRHVFMGYLHDAETSNARIDDRGFLHTADTGTSDRDGFLYLTGRLSNLLVTAGGEAITPEPLEARLLAQLPAILSHVLLVGDKRKFLAALVTLKVVSDANGIPTDRLRPETVEALAAQGCAATTVAEVLQDRTQKIRKVIDAAVSEVNSKAPSEHHRIMRWDILPADFSPSNEALTPTLKINRKVVVGRAKASIDRLYGNEEVEDYSSADWFHGGISREDTETLRKRDGGGQDGWFLIRKSTKEKNTFVITLLFKGKLYHNQIVFADGTYNTHKDQGNHQYETLQALVDHHAEGANGFQCKLTAACKKLR